MESRRSPTTGKVDRNSSRLRLTTYWACPTCGEALNSRTWGRHDCEPGDSAHQEEDET